MKINEIENKRTVILGFGKEGEDTLEFIRREFPEKVVGIADIKEGMSPMEGVDLHLGPNYLECLEDYDLAIKSPGVPMRDLEPYLKKGLRVTSQADIFLDNAKGRIIGITGTKGKSTTASLIQAMLLKRGFNSVLIGNIGEPALKHLADDAPSRIYVYELSSFQLETAEKSPQVAVILNLYKDHLDHHRDMDEYKEAKFRITKFQTEKDILIFNDRNPATKEMAERSRAIKMPFDPDSDPLGIRKEVTVPAEVLLRIAEIFDIPRSGVIESIKNFAPLPHRLEYVGEHRGVRFYNDSAATIPEAAISAIDKMGDELDTIIVGGVDKGFDLRKLSERITASPARNVILFPETGRIVGDLITKSRTKKIKLLPAESMEEAVSTAFRVTKKGKVCLLAPAASSFNMFKSYKERGDIFKRCVKDEKTGS